METKDKIFNVRLWPMVPRDGNERGPRTLKGEELPPKIIPHSEVGKMFPEITGQIDALDAKKATGPFRYNVDGMHYTINIKRIC